MNITHIRKANVIRVLAQPAVVDENGNEKKPAVSESRETFKSINRAKVASRELQKKAGVVLRAPR